MARENITITLYMSELIYDVENKTHLTSRSRSNGENHEEVANMQANEDEENRNQIIRSIGNAFASLKNKFSEYLTEEENNADNKLIDGNSNLSLSLSMPSNFNKSTKDTIASAMHKFIVNSAVGEWFAMTNKNDAVEYIQSAAANILELREAINKRTRPQRSDV